MILPVPKRELLARALDKSGCNRLLQLAGSWNGLLVLNYHRIGDPAGSAFDWDLWSASAEDFAQQVKYLTRNFDVIGAGDLEDVLRNTHDQMDQASRKVMITFDDGYRDNFELAYPILREHSTTATFFLATGFLDIPKVAWWDEIAWMVRSSNRSRIDANIWTIQPVDFDDPDRTVAVQSLLGTFKRLDGHETGAYLDFLAAATGSGRCPNELADDMWMTWDMVREMRQGGMCFGGHTVNHPVLSSLSAEEQDLEICECRLRIERELGESIDTFSYPVGGPEAFNDATRRSLSNHGFRWAFSYYGGYSRPGQFDCFDIPRVAVETDTSTSAFRSVTSLPQLFA